jgi:hypothetical protein
MTAIAFVPPLAVAVAIALVIGIAGRIGLSSAGIALVAGCVALSPLTQNLHGVGIVDHHFAEYLAWLAAMWASLRWLSPSASRWDAVLAGLILGIAPILHTDLFILQIPLLVALGYLRLRCGVLHVRSANAFAATLLATTLVMLLPSLAFREGRFEFFTLSWFHLYAAAATGTFCLLAVHLPRTRHAAIALTGAGFLLALPGAGQLLMASEFLVGDLELLDRISEARSPWQMAAEAGGAARISGYYSLLIWTSPLVLAGCLFEFWRSREPREATFWAASAIGLALMFLQFRFHNFGSLALYLPIVLWTQRAATARGIATNRVIAVLAVALLAAYVPAIRGELFAVRAPANDIDYARTRTIYPALADACRRDPGVVLASSGDGHYVRYHTDCGVIANHFVITRQHEQKLQELSRLFELAPSELRAARPDVKYVFVRFTFLYARDPQGKVSALARPVVAAASPRLVRELLLSERRALPEGFRLISEIAPPDEPNEPYARLFALGIE